MQPLVGVIMGSQSDWEVMSQTVALLDEFQIPSEAKVISAHRAPEALVEYAKSAESRGLEVLIAGAGMAAALPGMLAALSPLPVLGVPLQAKALRGLDSLLSISQMPGGVPVAAFAIGSAGAKNAALFAASILARSRKDVREALLAWRAKQTEAAVANSDPKG